GFGEHSVSWYPKRRIELEQKRRLPDRSHTFPTKSRSPPTGPSGHPRLRPNKLSPYGVPGPMLFDRGQVVVRGAPLSLQHRKGHDRERDTALQTPKRCNDLPLFHWP